MLTIGKAPTTSLTSPPPWPTPLSKGNKSLNGDNDVSAPLRLYNVLAYCTIPAVCVPPPPPEVTVGLEMSTVLLELTEDTGRSIRLCRYPLSTFSDIFKNLR